MKWMRYSCSMNNLNWHIQLFGVDSICLAACKLYKRRISARRIAWFPLCIMGNVFQSFCSFLRYRTFLGFSKFCCSPVILNILATSGWLGTFFLYYEVISNRWIPKNSILDSLWVHIQIFKWFSDTYIDYVNTLSWKIDNYSILY